MVAGTEMGLQRLMNKRCSWSNEESRTLCERSLECGNEVFICFVDFEKAFDRVNWVKMFEIRKSLHIDWRDRRLLQDLYMRQEAVVRTVGGDSDPGVIGRG